jgi:hypothetical protein
MVTGERIYNRMNARILLSRELLLFIKKRGEGGGGIYQLVWFC